MSLESIVNVVITRGTKSVTRAGFGVPLIAGLHTRFMERVRTYTGTAGMLTDGFLTSDAEYKMGQAIMAQSPKPNSFKVGRRTAAVAQVATVTPNVTSQTIQHFIETINGTAYDFTSDASPTAAEVVTGLIALINADSACPSTATGTTTLILTAKVAGTPFTHGESANLSAVATTANNGIQEDLAAIINADNDWYCLLTTSRVASDIELAAQSIEAVLKIYIACSADSGVKDSTSTTDVGYILKSKAYTRTALLYSSDQADYPDGAWAGRVLPLDPGTETWKFKTLAGISPDDALTDSEKDALSTEAGTGKNVNFYCTVAGVQITQMGKVASGEWIDAIRLIDAIVAGIKEDIFALYVNSDKIPFTNKGIGLHENKIRGVLAGFGVDAIREFDVTVPDVDAISDDDRNARILSGIEFTATLSGAIHSSKINGFVAV